MILNRLSSAAEAWEGASVKLSECGSACDFYKIAMPLIGYYFDLLALPPAEWLPRDFKAILSVCADGVIAIESRNMDLLEGVVLRMYCTGIFFRTLHLVASGKPEWLIGARDMDSVRSQVYKETLTDICKCARELMSGYLHCGFLGDLVSVFIRFKFVEKSGYAPNTAGFISSLAELASLCRALILRRNEFRSNAEHLRFSSDLVRLTGEFIEHKKTLTRQ